MTVELREYCLRCQTVTPSQKVVHASGVEFLCMVCGGQVDFLHNEEEEEPYWDGGE